MSSQQCYGGRAEGDRLAHCSGYLSAAQWRLGTRARTSVGRLGRTQAALPAGQGLSGGRCTHGGAPSLACNRQHAAHTVQQTACSEQHAACNMQRATCTAQHGTGGMSRVPDQQDHATCLILHETFHMDIKPRRQASNMACSVCLSCSMAWHGIAAFKVRHAPMRDAMRHAT